MCKYYGEYFPFYKPYRSSVARKLTAQLKNINVQTEVLDKNIPPNEMLVKHLNTVVEELGPMEETFKNNRGGVDINTKEDVDVLNNFCRHFDRLKKTIRCFKKLNPTAYLKTGGRPKDPLDITGSEKPNKDMKVRRGRKPTSSSSPTWSSAKPSRTSCGRSPVCCATQRRISTESEIA